MIAKNGKFLFFVNILSFFVSHRLPIAQALKEMGFEVVVAYGELGRVNPKVLADMGIKTYFIPIRRGSVNVFHEIKTIFNMWGFVRAMKPNIVHLVTIKPYLYVGVIARLQKVPAVVSAVAGLGNIFLQKNFKIRVLRFFLFYFFKFAFNHPNQKVIFQNKDDADFLIKWNVINRTKTCLIQGSGINLDKFVNLNEIDSNPIICFPGRLIKQKGVNDFILAARILKKRGIKGRFILAGDIDPENPSSLNLQELNYLKKEGIVEIIGYENNIPKLLYKSHIICLPSYREGLPKALAEAAAASRVVVTTNVPGCRDAIIPNKTGLLVPLQNPLKLAEAIQWLIENPKKRVEMGKAGRVMAQNRFDIKKIVAEHIKIYSDLLA